MVMHRRMGQSNTYRKMVLRNVPVDGQDNVKCKQRICQGLPSAVPICRWFHSYYMHHKMISVLKTQLLYTSTSSCVYYIHHIIEHTKHIQLSLIRSVRHIRRPKC